MPTADVFFNVNVQAIDWQEHVREVHVVVQPGGTSGHPDLGYNHITHYLAIANGRSVEIHARHGSDADVHIRFEMTSRNYTYQDSPSRIMDFDVPVHQDRQFTVRNVYDFILAHELYVFRYGGGGVGCRFWVVTIIKLYEHNLWVRSGAAMNLFNDLSFIYSATPPRVAAYSRIRAGLFNTRTANLLVDQHWWHMDGQVERRIRDVQAQCGRLTTVLTNMMGKPALAAQQLEELHREGVTLRYRRDVHDRLIELGREITVLERSRVAIQAIVRDSRWITQEIIPF